MKSKFALKDLDDGSTISTHRTVTAARRAMTRRARKDSRDEARPGRYGIAYTGVIGCPVTEDAR